MFDYDADRLRLILTELTRSTLSSEVWAWLNEKINTGKPADFNTAFVLMPRKTGKSVITISDKFSEEISRIKPGLTLKNWTADRLGRLYLIVNLDATDQLTYGKTIENLFLTAEVSELVALYSALPFLAWADNWKMRCAEGVRSNIGSVLEAVMYDNPYPSDYLDENAWNQLVMRAFFTDKNVNRIIGLDERANADLTTTISDYVNERKAAGRKINPLLWRLTAKFMDENLLNNLKEVIQNGSKREMQAAALTLFSSDFRPAADVLEEYPEFLAAIKNKELNWDSLGPED